MGDRLFIYWKQRSPTESEKLFEAECAGVESISIKSKEQKVLINGSVLSNREMIALALADGFEDLDSFFQFFNRNYGDSFQGDLIHFEQTAL